MLYKQTDRQQGTEKYITLLAVQFLGVLFIYLFLLPPAVARSLNTGCGLRNSISPVTHKQCSIFFLSSSSSFPRACKPSLVLSASGSIVCLLRRVFISFFFFFFFLLPHLTSFLHASLISAFFRASLFGLHTAKFLLSPLGFRSGADPLHRWAV